MATAKASDVNARAVAADKAGQSRSRRGARDSSTRARAIAALSIRESPCPIAASIALGSEARKA